MSKYLIIYHISKWLYQQIITFKEAADLSLSKYFIFSWPLFKQRIISSLIIFFEVNDVSFNALIRCQSCDSKRVANNKKNNHSPLRGKNTLLRDPSAAALSSL